MALVQRGIAHLRQHGPEKAFADFNSAGGGFVDGDYYLVALDRDCILQANGGNPALVGNDDSNLKDVDGKAIAPEFLHVAHTRGSGWVDYRWPHPKSGRIQPKSSYVEREGDFVIACGVYLTQDAAAAAQSALH
jgi:signal transduction histidine kinase